MTVTAFIRSAIGAAPATAAIPSYLPHPITNDSDQDLSRRHPHQQGFDPLSPSHMIVVDENNNPTDTTNNNRDSFHHHPERGRRQTRPERELEEAQRRRYSLPRNLALQPDDEE